MLSRGLNIESLLFRNLVSFEVMCALCSTLSVMIFVNVFLKCSSGFWAGALATVQTYLLPELQRKNITEHRDGWDATQCRLWLQILHTMKKFTNE